MNFFFNNLFVFSQVEKFLNGENCFAVNYIKFKKTELVEISELNLTSTANNRFNFRIMNSLLESWGLRLTLLDCKFKKIQIQIIMYINVIII